MKLLNDRYVDPAETGLSNPHEAGQREPIKPWRGLLRIRAKRRTYILKSAMVLGSIDVLEGRAEFYNTKVQASDRFPFVARVHPGAYAVFHDFEFFGSKTRKKKLNGLLLEGGTAIAARGNIHDVTNGFCENDGDFTFEEISVSNLVLHDAPGAQGGLVRGGKANGKSFNINVEDTMNGLVNGALFFQPRKNVVAEIDSGYLRGGPYALRAEGPSAERSSRGEVDLKVTNCVFGPPPEGTPDFAAAYFFDGVHPRSWLGNHRGGGPYDPVAETLPLSPMFGNQDDPKYIDGINSMSEYAALMSRDDFWTRHKILPSREGRLSATVSNLARGLDRLRPPTR